MVEWGTSNNNPTQNWASRVTPRLNIKTMLNFQTYESNTLEDLGQVSKILGAKGSIRFSSDRNIASTKRITVILQLQDGQSVAIPCSSKVSDIARKALKDHSEAEVLGVISSLHILETEDNKHFISPTGSGEGTPLKASFTLAELKKSKVSWDELVDL